MPDGQTTPQAPQLKLDDVRFTSQPLAASPSQLAKPALQAPIEHVPFTHTVLAFGKLQTLPQAPQLFVLFDKLVSQPFARIPSQFEKPELQDAIVQFPPTHEVTAFG